MSDLQQIAQQGQAIIDSRTSGWDVAEYGDGGVVGGVSFGNVPAWHGLLNVRPEELGTMQDVWTEYPEAALKVTKQPVYTADMQLVPRTYVTMREDGKILGVVGEKYKVYQNVAITEFGDALLDTGEANIETAVVTRNGARFFVVFRIPKSIEIAGLDTEQIILYLLISNSHDASSPLRGVVTPVRAQCTNTEAFAIKTAPRMWTVRHTSSLDGRLQEARKALDMTFTYTEALEELGNTMVNQKLRGSDFSAFLNKLVPVPRDEGRGQTMRQNVQDQIRALYQNSPNLENIRNTRWAALQAVTEYYDHHMPSRETAVATSDENRFERIIEGDVKSLPNRALALLT